MLGTLYEVFYLNEENKKDSFLVRAISLDELVLKIYDKGINPENYLTTKAIPSTFPKEESKIV